MVLLLEMGMAKMEYVEDLRSIVRCLVSATV
jgi:hypothetical protein